VMGFSILSSGHAERIQAEIKSAKETAMMRYAVSMHLGWTRALTAPSQLQRVT